MSTITNELIEAAAALAIPVEKLPVADAAARRSQLAQTFKFNPLSPLAGTPHNLDSIHHPSAWSWLSQFLPDDPIILFFRPEDDPEMLKIPSGKTLVPLLEQTTGWVFYIAPF